MIMITFLYQNYFLNSFYGEKICLKMENQENNLMKITTVHNMMNDCIHIANKSFSIQLIPWFMTIMNSSIFNLFQFYRIGVQYDQQSFLRASNNFIWCFFNWSFILFIIQTSNQYIEEVISFMFHLHSIT